MVFAAGPIPEHIATDTKVAPKPLFQKNERSYILKSGNSLEYNISTRRLNVIEPSVIEIIPPGEMPKKDKSSYLDIIIPQFYLPVEC